MTRKRNLGWLPLAVTVACGGASPAKPAAPAVDEASAAGVFADLEARLLAAKSIRYQAQITSSGAIAIALEGAASIAGDSVSMTFVGDMEGTGMTVRLEADAATIKGGSAQRGFEQTRPPALTEGLVIGLTRMGALHNLAVMSAGKPPDKTDGTVKQWVTTSNARFHDGDANALAFDLTVGGQPAGSAVLWLDAQTRLPTRREQTVNFASGSMSVVEVYDGFAIDE